MTWFFICIHLHSSEGVLHFLEGIAYTAFSEGRRLLKDIMGPLFCDRRRDEVDLFEFVSLYQFLHTLPLSPHLCHALLNSSTASPSCISMLFDLFPSNTKCSISIPPKGYNKGISSNHGNCKTPKH
ncbi:hypothetical protein QBC32DRAFT_168589 [Pseudoneurospora amorphoporcata]|uniref:Uncharacterized protein n=1 Tax=Pseudoneurospora amorphoporcata TaxID=241081 RepID=A0AAN6SF03_9PEZI|nr:hypothetical protein QBC32DRAFT_168589 [Pseudoneurospora amorphoporcata]